MKEAGAASILLLAASMVVVVFIIALVDVAAYLDARARASSAADAAALAAAPVTFSPFGAVGSPADEARRYAAANGAVMVSCVCTTDASFEDRSVVVQVRLRHRSLLVGVVTVEATGRAQFRPSLLGSSQGDVDVRAGVR